MTITELKDQMAIREIFLGYVRLIDYFKKFFLNEKMFLN